MKKFIALILISLLTFSCEGWFGSGWVKQAIKEHAQVYEKFYPEWESNDIKVVRTVNLELMRPKTVQRTKPVLYTYTPNTRHLGLYLNSFEKLESNLKLNSALKSFLMGFSLSGISILGLLKSRHKGKILLSTLIGGLLLPIANVLHENKSYGKQPHFDKWLKKHENYFSNCSSRTLKRILFNYFILIIGSLMPMGFIFILNK